jgi:hypothetical protein
LIPEGYNQDNNLVIITPGCAQSTFAMEFLEKANVKRRGLRY